MANRLAHAMSPYLRQHAENPVDWREWGEEAFAEAAARDVPVLVSIGYAACHWCHVMAHESFEDEATAETMNRDFVNIKVDREERPDVDAAYMNATTMLTGHGGWPMTVFVTPDGRPFYAGTYLPPRPSHHLPAFTQLLAAITDAWQNRREELEGSAERITGAVAQRIDAGMTPGDSLTIGDLDRAVRNLLSQEDRHHGGFGGAPKFPPSMVCEFLLRHAASAGEAASDALELAERTLQAMAGSGMYDQLAGGFARYAVDSGWVVPHFEKMLYDNAQLARVYLHWFRLTGSPVGRRIAEQTCDWMVAELRTDQGGLASSLDADTDGHEGLTYVWTPQQLRDVLGEEGAAWVADLCVVTPAGTFEEGASTLQLRDDAAIQRWIPLRDKLKRARDARPQPTRDDKVVAAWNGLAIAALAEASVLLDRPDLLDAAVACADVLIAVHLADDGTWRRVSRDGTAGSAPATLEDLGCLAEGLFTLHGATGDAAWRELGGGVVEAILRDHMVERDGEDVLTDVSQRVADPRVSALGTRADPTDNASPSGASMAAGVILTWATLTGRSSLRSHAEALVVGSGALIRQSPRFTGWWLAVASALDDGPVQIELAGAGLPGWEQMRRSAVGTSWPGSVVTWDADPSRLPVTARATAYVCDALGCAAPTVEAQGWARPGRQ